MKNKQKEWHPATKHLKSSPAILARITYLMWLLWSMHGCIEPQVLQSQPDIGRSLPYSLTLLGVSANMDADCHWSEENFLSLIGQ
jgi:hypothetical protein